MTVFADVLEFVGCNRSYKIKKDGAKKNVETVRRLRGNFKFVFYLSHHILVATLSSP
jgi:hypothetical protein